MAKPRTPNEIERDIEATRARLADTVDMLAYRAHPKTIATRQVESTKARFDAEFYDANHNLRTDKVVKVAAAAVGSLVVLILIRRSFARRRA